MHPLLFYLWKGPAIPEGSSSWRRRLEQGQAQTDWFALDSVFKGKICEWMKDNCREQSSCIWLFKYQLPIGQIFKGPYPRVSPPLSPTLCKISFWRLNLFTFHWLCSCSELKYLIYDLCGQRHKWTPWHKLAVKLWSLYRHTHIYMCYVCVYIYDSFKVH